MISDTSAPGFDVVDITDDYFVLNKHPGVSMHKDDTEAGLVMRVAHWAGAEQLFPVHRLDKMTSGLVLLARTAEAASVLSTQFQSRTVEKYYLALSDMKPRKKQGLIKGDMEKARRGSWKLCKTQYNPALTQFFSHSVAPGLRLFLLKPHTGKTHQLRVALKSIGAPIIGDQRYHSAAAAPQARGYLHAYQIAFDWRGQRKKYRSVPTSGELFRLAGVQQQIGVWSEPSQLGWPQL